MEAVFPGLLLAVLVIFIWTQLEANFMVLKRQAVGVMGCLWSDHKGLQGQLVRKVSKGLKVIRAQSGL
jgi:hypothetical protein